MHSQHPTFYGIRDHSDKPHGGRAEEAGMSHKLVDRVLKNGPHAQAERMVLIAIASFTNSKTGQCNPSVPGIAERAAMTERGVRQILRRLEAAGWLVTLGGGGRHERSTYLIKTEMLEKNPEPRAGYSSRNPERDAPFCDPETRNLNAGNPERRAPEPVKNPVKSVSTPLPPMKVSDRGAPPPTRAPAARSDGLDAFASAYPATPETPTPEAVAADPRVKRAWQRAIRSGADPEDVIAGARRFAAMVAAEGREPRFITRPANFLLGKAWQAEHRPDPARCARSADLAMQNPATRAAVASMVGAQSRDRLRAAEARFLAGRRAA